MYFGLYSIFLMNVMVYNFSFITVQTRVLFDMADCTLCMGVFIEDSDGGFFYEKKVKRLNLNVHRYMYSYSLSFCS